MGQENMPLQREEMVSEQEKAALQREKGIL